MFGFRKLKDITAICNIQVSVLKLRDETIAKQEATIKAWEEYASSAYIHEQVYVEWIKKNGEVGKRSYVKKGEYIELDGRTYLESKVKDRLGAFTTERTVRFRKDRPFPNDVSLSEYYSRHYTGSIEDMLNRPSSIL